MAYSHRTRAKTIREKRQTSNRIVAFSSTFTRCEWVLYVSKKKNVPFRTIFDSWVGERYGVLRQGDGLDRRICQGDGLRWRTCQGVGLESRTYVWYFCKEKKLNNINTWTTIKLLQKRNPIEIIIKQWCLLWLIFKRSRKVVWKFISNRTELPVKNSRCPALRR